MSDEHELRADKSGERLDVFVARSIPELTRSRASKLIDEGLVSVDGTQASKVSKKLSAGQRVAVTIPPPKPTKIEPEAMLLTIVYEDGDLLVVDKPAGMAVHPSPGHSSHTLVNGILAHCDDLSGIGGVKRPGIVHRLDKDTSGLIIVAKNDAAHVSLARQLQERKGAKLYVALGIRNALVEYDLEASKVSRVVQTDVAPYHVLLDGSSLFVACRGGIEASPDRIFAANAAGTRVRRSPAIRQR